MVRFGVAGHPLAFFESPFGKDGMKIFEWLHGLGLNAFEAQMTYGPKTSIEDCKKIKKLSEELDIKVSVHGAYYIVLASDDKVKVRRSIETLKKTFKLADLMGADTVVIHPGSLYGEDPKIIMDKLEKNIGLFFDEIGDSHIGLFLETAGKKGQIGSVEEILYLSDNIKGCFPCIDFGHVHAREGGSLRSPESIDKLFDVLKKHKMFSKNNRIHFHYTPIHYGNRGEIMHKKIDDKDDKNNLYHPRYERIVENIAKLKIPVTVISETHNSQEQGAMAMRDVYKRVVT